MPVAFLLLIICIICLALGLSRRMTGRRHALLTFAWLCAAVATTVVIFSFFPDSRADGSFLGASLGGAAAFVVVILLTSVRVQKQLSALDKSESLAQQQEDQVAELTREVESLRQRYAPHALTRRDIQIFRVNGSDDKTVGIVTGDLRNVDNCDIWVNSENLDMQMSRFHERSISGLIRYEGAERDETGRVLVDRVADELARAVAGRTPVAAGTAIATSAGNLTKTNLVRHIVHSAAVQGEPGTGYRQVRVLDRCVRETLRLAEQLTVDHEPCSIIFPLLGCGEGGAAASPTAQILISTAIAYFRSTPESRIHTVYFLAYTDLELSACMDAIRTLRLQKAKKR